MNKKNIFNNKLIVRSEQIWFDHYSFNFINTTNTDIFLYMYQYL